MDKAMLYKYLFDNPNWVETLKEALEIEEKKDSEWQDKGWGHYSGWEWHDVHTSPVELNKMVLAKLIDVTTSSRSGKTYRVKNPDIIKQVISSIEESTIDVVSVSAEIPNDLFKCIIGYDDVKELLHAAISSENTVHVLFGGPPASAKTLFLLELHRIPNSYYTLAPTLTEAGLSNLLFTYKPRYLIIDEIDRLQYNDIGQLNSLMATGKVIEVKYGKTRTIELNTSVFAAGVNIDKLPHDLLSRFVKLYFQPYTKEQFIQVSMSVMAREGIDNEICNSIANDIWSLYGNNADIRQCIYVARMIANDVTKKDTIISVIRKYGVRRIILKGGIHEED